MVAYVHRWSDYQEPKGWLVVLIDNAAHLAMTAGLLYLRGATT